MTSKSIKNYLLTVLALMTFSLVSCVEEKEDANSVISSSNDIEVDVYLNGGINTSDPVQATIGDTISAKVRFQNISPEFAEVKYMIFQSCGLTTLLQNYSSSLESPVYTLTNSDVTSCTLLVISVRYQDESSSGALVSFNKQVQIQVDNSSVIPVVSSTNLYVNGVLTVPGYSGLNVRVGDSVSVEVNAYDLNSLPLEYKFVRFRNNTLSAVLQNFGSSNSLTNYIVTNEDLSSGLYIYFGVKNNDSTDFDSSFFGDLQAGIRINVDP